jgi:hypothetical protein
LKKVGSNGKRQMPGWNFCGSYKSKENILSSAVMNDGEWMSFW